MKPTAFLTCLGLVSSATFSSAQILPADRTTVWHPGVPGGVPDRTTVCAVVNASTYGNGASDASSGIRAAVNACPVGQVVQLSAGTFTVNNYILINKGITLRGAGPTATVLQKTNGAIAGVDHGATDNQPIVVVGPIAGRNRTTPRRRVSSPTVSEGQRRSRSPTPPALPLASSCWSMPTSTTPPRGPVCRLATARPRASQSGRPTAPCSCGTTPPTRFSTIRFRAR